MSMYEAVKQISQQSESSITVNGMHEMLKEAKIQAIPMGYDSWGNFSHSQVLYVIEGKGYIVRRKRPHKGSTVEIFSTSDGLTTNTGKNLTQNEIKVFKKLGLG